MHINQHIIIKIAISLTLVVLLSTAHMGFVDDVGHSYTESSFKRALITFGIARGLNGVISVAQGTEVALQPAGIGVNFAPGQILDPANDLIERFSNVMLICSASLGVQRLVLDIIAWPGFTALMAVFFVAVFCLMWFKYPVNKSLRQTIYRFTVVIIILRFAVPGFAIVNEGLYHLFIAPQYEMSKQKLEETTQVISAIHDDTQQTTTVPNSDPSLLDGFKRFYDTTVSQIDISKRVEAYKAAAAELSEYTINLIVVFVLQTILFPLLFLWILVAGIKKTV